MKISLNLGKSNSISRNISMLSVDSCDNDFFIVVKSNRFSYHHKHGGPKTSFMVLMYGYDIFHMPENLPAQTHVLHGNKSTHTTHIIRFRTYIKPRLY